VSKIFEALNKAQSQPVPVEEPAAGEILPVPERHEALAEGEFDEVWREFDVLRSGVEGNLGTLVDKSIVFASSVSGEGASTVAARFAIALRALRWIRPVLIDANLRNPTVRQVFDLPPSDGLVEIFTDAVSVEKAAVKVGGGGLSVITEGRTIANPQALFTPRNVSRFIGEVRRHYNCIIVDVPAVTGNPETKVIASLCDGVVLVIETARTKREVALRSKDTLTSSGARILGTVLNKRKYVIPDLLYKRI
jgi:capsular exopolysaccharide synthesis family protein